MTIAKRLLLLGAVALLALAAATPAHAAAQVSDQDRHYLETIHQTNLAEIAAGELAQERGHSQHVRDIGARIMTDHMDLDEVVQDTASELGVSLPDAPTEHQQAVHEQLQQASGEEFDALFVSTQLEGHMQALHAGEQELAQGSNEQVMMIARDAAPVIAGHHEALQQAAQELGLPHEVDTGSGGAAAQSTGTASGLAVMGGAAVLLVSAAFFARARTARGPA